MNNLKKIIKFIILFGTILISSLLGYGMTYIVYLAHIAIIYLLFKLVRKVFNKITEKINNRVILVISVIISTVIMGYGYYNMHHVVPVEYEIDTNKAIRSEGYKAVLISDVHTGISISLDEMEQIASKIEEIKPDMILLCGDIVDESTTKKQMQRVFEIFGSIESEYGTFYVYGNHDRQFKWSESFTDEELEAAIKNSNITILQDEALKLNEEFVLVGREDYSAERLLGQEQRKSIAELLKDVDKEAFILTMDHQPREYDENSDAGTDLLVSGHTHNGQIWPGNIFLECTPFGDGVCGEYKVSNMKAYVTAGFAGWGLPIKTSSRAEYIVINIH